MLLLWPSEVRRNREDDLAELGWPFLLVQTSLTCPLRRFLQPPIAKSKFLKTENLKVMYFSMLCSINSCKVLLQNVKKLLVILSGKDCTIGSQGNDTSFCSL